MPGNQLYPGGAPFDPLKYSMSADEFVDQQVRPASQCFNTIHAVTARHALYYSVDANEGPDTDGYR